MNDEYEREVTRELPLNDSNSPGDSRAVGDSPTFETVSFEKNPSSSGSSRSLEDLEPFETVEKLGLEMKALFSNWSQEFLPSKEFEEETVKRMDDLKKQAYILEAEFLESKLEIVKKRITET
ncbi:hypothetical protein HNY73_021814 [Argiope bruennichi]|uniref:Uncharacterized protein n=1 Tax=Argiope bruennichi TaxID=94029 RepID=A0A8T0E305_ARGBR|nr:hypothetical protein HNY73_021814 [Argiope bruennichi]